MPSVEELTVEILRRQTEGLPNKLVCGGGHSWVTFPHKCVGHQEYRYPELQREC